MFLPKMLVAQESTLEYHHAPPANRPIAGRAGDPITPVGADDWGPALGVGAESHIVLLVVLL